MASDVVAMTAEEAQQRHRHVRRHDYHRSRKTRSPGSVSGLMAPAGEVTSLLALGFSSEDHASSKSSSAGDDGPPHDVSDSGSSSSPLLLLSTDSAPLYSDVAFASSVTYCDTPLAKDGEVKQRLPLSNRRFSSPTGAFDRFPAGLQVCPDGDSPYANRSMLDTSHLQFPPPPPPPVSPASVQHRRFSAGYKPTARFSRDPSFPADPPAECCTSAPPSNLPCDIESCVEKVVSVQPQWTTRRPSGVTDSSELVPNLPSSSAPNSNCQLELSTGETPENDRKGEIDNNIARVGSDQSSSGSSTGGESQGIHSPVSSEEHCKQDPPGNLAATASNPSSTFRPPTKPNGASKGHGTPGAMRGGTVRNLSNTLPPARGHHGHATCPAELRQSGRTLPVRTLQKQAAAANNPQSSKYSSSGSCSAGLSSVPSLGSSHRSASLDLAASEGVGPPMPACRPVSPARWGARPDSGRDAARRLPPRCSQHAPLDGPKRHPPAVNGAQPNGVRSPQARRRSQSFSFSCTPPPPPHHPAASTPPISTTPATSTLRTASSRVIASLRSDSSPSPLNPREFCDRTSAAMCKPSRRRSDNETTTLRPQLLRRSYETEITSAKTATATSAEAGALRKRQKSPATGAGGQRCAAFAPRVQAPGAERACARASPQPWLLISDAEHTTRGAISWAQQSERQPPINTKPPRRKARHRDLPAEHATR
ncbi:hypothetical protein DIPPA_12471 [Diplonema papillatum]|nr:hypothetical protein DIPPA_12471 [Diplonema papillatum]